MAQWHGVSKRKPSGGRKRMMRGKRRTEISSEKQYAVLGESKRKKYRKTGASTQVKVLSRGTSGRVLALEIQDGSNNSPLLLRFDAIRRSLPQLPSTLFVIRSAGNGVWNFLGGGFGHGAGLSQAGAIDLALRGNELFIYLKFQGASK